MWSVLVDKDIGMCVRKSSKLLTNCKNAIEFQKEFREVCNNWNVRNQLIFYFSGHGEKRSNIYALQFGDSNPTYYFINDLFNTIGFYSIQSAIIIIDACQSGAITTGTIKGSSKKTQFEIPLPDIPAGIAVITSSRETGFSHEKDDGSFVVSQKQEWEN